MEACKRNLTDRTKKDDAYELKDSLVTYFGYPLFNKRGFSKAPNEHREQIKNML